MTETTSAGFRNQEAAKITGEKIDFSFGENWKKYLEGVDEQTIIDAEDDFKRVAGVKDLRGRTFLDIGCGSGMNSLIAYRLNADRVLSIDYDPNSVEAASYLRSKFATDDERWEIKRGSALDPDFMRSLGTHSFVLSWGVLHHTGSMWEALEIATQRIEDGGVFYIALYNHNRHAHRWLKIKRFYNHCPRVLKKLMVLGHGTYGMTRAMLKLRSPLSVFKKRRGMNYWRDIEDWLGGLPYEYCKPDDLIDFMAPKGFQLQKILTTYGHGCNEFVFRYQPNAR